MISANVVSWWSLLCAVGVVNITAWWLSAASLKRRRAMMSSESYTTCRRQLLLSSVYVFGCAFRSVLPVFDVPRICLFDTWLSSVIVGRTVATCAELCFVSQWALLLRDSARTTGSVSARIVSRTVVPMIAVAELCSWSAVLTTSNLGHVFEESLWGLSACLLVISIMGIWPRCPPSWRPALIAGCVAALAYVGFMFLIDVPMYWSRWIADEAQGRQYLSIAQGFQDAIHCKAVSNRWQDWKSEVVWMSLYFSAAVWISILLIHASARHATYRSRRALVRA